MIDPAAWAVYLLLTSKPRYDEGNIVETWSTQAECKAQADALNGWYRWNNPGHQGPPHNTYECKPLQ